MSGDAAATLPRTGTFCWPELATTDTAAARTFYGGLFGWDFFDDPGPAGNYIHARLGGREVGALRALGAPGEPPDMPAFWNNYVSVGSTDDTLKSVAAAGGRVMMGPYDAGENGRLAVLQDPVGAVFAVWQAKKHLGAAVTGEPGSLGWMQLNATDPVKAEAFYTKVFGWGVRRDAMPQGGGDYHTYSVDGVPFAGSMALPPGLDAPSHWLTYFAVADVDAAHAKAASLKATTYVPPTDIPGIARFAVLADPQGATFAIIRFTR
jgi:predicted enzyme related to lactoylglutathione lyase